MCFNNLMKFALLLLVAVFFGSTAFAQQLPKGTVISWIPPKDSIDLRDPANPKIRLPTGWKSCDAAADGFKQGRFIYGESLANYIAHIKNKDQLFGGSEKHGHSATMGDNDKIVTEIDPGSGKSAADAYHKHTVSIGEGSSIPPYVFAILLCN